MRKKKVDPTPFLPTHRSSPVYLRVSVICPCQVWSHSTGWEVQDRCSFRLPFSPCSSTHFSLSLTHAFTPLLARLILRFRASSFTFTLPTSLLVPTPSSAQINSIPYPTTSSELTRHGAKRNFVLGPSCCQQSLHSSIETTKRLEQ